MAFFSFLISFFLFLYAALSPVLNYSIDPDFNTVAWGLMFFVLGHLLPGFFAFRAGGPDGRRNYRDF